MSVGECVSMCVCTCVHAFLRVTVAFMFWSHLPSLEGDQIAQSTEVLHDTHSTT